MERSLASETCSLSLSTLFFIPTDNNGETCFHNLCFGEQVSFA